MSDLLKAHLNVLDGLSFFRQMESSFKCRAIKAFGFLTLISLRT